MARLRKNKDFNPFNCGVTHFLNKVGGKWKVLVIHAISSGYNRFSVLEKVVPQISKQMLVNQLHELEDDGIIERTVFAEMPPRVEYNLSEYGLSILSVTQAIQEWGDRDLKK